MKKLILGAIALFALSTQAFAYSSAVGSDPKNGEGNVEYKYVVKSAIAGESAAVSKGQVLFYASAYDGYTVTNMGQSNTSADSQHAIACIAADAIATGDTGYRRCVTRGYVDYLYYDANAAAITQFRPVCGNNAGSVSGCGLAVTSAQNLTGSATAALGKIVPLQTKASGVGNDLKAIINIP